MTARTVKPIFERWNFFGTERSLVQIQSSRPEIAGQRAKASDLFLFSKPPISRCPRSERQFKGQRRGRPFAGRPARRLSAPPLAARSRKSGAPRPRRRACSRSLWHGPSPSGARPRPPAPARSRASSRAWRPLSPRAPSPPVHWDGRGREGQPGSRRVDAMRLPWSRQRPAAARLRLSAHLPVSGPRATPPTASCPSARLCSACLFGWPGSPITGAPLLPYLTRRLTALFSSSWPHVHNAFPYARSVRIYVATLF